MNKRRVTPYTAKVVKHTDICGLKAQIAREDYNRLMSTKAGQFCDVDHRSSPLILRTSICENPSTPSTQYIPRRGQYSGYIHSGLGFTDVAGKEKGTGTAFPVPSKATEIQSRTPVPHTQNRTRELKHQLATNFGYPGSHIAGLIPPSLSHHTKLCGHSEHAAEVQKFAVIDTDFSSLTQHAALLIWIYVAAFVLLTNLSISNSFKLPLLHQAGAAPEIEQLNVAPDNIPIIFRPNSQKSIHDAIDAKHKLSLFEYVRRSPYTTTENKNIGQSTHVQNKLISRNVQKTPAIQPTLNGRLEKSTQTTNYRSTTQFQASKKTYTNHGDVKYLLETNTQNKQEMKYFPNLETENRKSIISNEYRPNDHIPVTTMRSSTYGHFDQQISSENSKPSILGKTITIPTTTRAWVLAHPGGSPPVSQLELWFGFWFRALLLVFQSEPSLNIPAFARLDTALARIGLLLMGCLFSSCFPRTSRRTATERVPRARNPGNQANNPNAARMRRTNNAERASRTNQRRTESNRNARDLNTRYCDSTPQPANSERSPRTEQMRQQRPVVRNAQDGNTSNAVTRNSNDDQTSLHNSQRNLVPYPAKSDVERDEESDEQRDEESEEERDEQRDEERDEESDEQRDVERDEESDEESEEERDVERDEESDEQRDEERDEESDEQRDEESEEERDEESDVERDEESDVERDEESDEQRDEESDEESDKERDEESEEERDEESDEQGDEESEEETDE
ncbi:hypothetical protein B566_EDAN008043 [Ephemera danica]|nr:hypothetical protein B566_EDAN008043 [Ephemera danica]